MLQFVEEYEQFVAIFCVPFVSMFLQLQDMLFRTCKGSLFDENYKDVLATLVCKQF